ncbi:MAG: phosphoglycolate phosphatase [Hydrogenophilaceae bacterium]|jgi:phosphoglycolate phosphatase|nr:phosphoglycolate phosphatase [Hydrogenophilaceae bacterium]
MLNRDVLGPLGPGELAGAVIAFDLDGTLVDTAPDLVRALNQTLDLEGLPHVAVPAVRGIVGHGARAMIARAAALAGAAFSDERLDALTLSFVDFYRGDIAAESRPFPGVPDTLAALSEAGATLAVCTNKRTELSQALLDALGLSDRFAAIVGADSVAERKPHPGHLIETVARAGGSITRALMVGDSSADVGAARAAGAPIVLVSFGYCDGRPLELGADVVVDRFNEIETAARRLIAPRS